MNSRLRWITALCLVFVSGLIGINGLQAQAAEPSTPTVPDVEVRFAHAPYVDHTDGAIAIEKGWFEDVGISLADRDFNVTFNKIPSVLTANTVDVASSNIYGLVPAMEQSPQLRMFAYGDLFMGFAIMGQTKYTSYKEFREQGLSHDEALKKAVNQMKGKRVALSTSPPDRAFFKDVLQLAGLTLGDVNEVSVEDPVGVAMMESGRAEFQMGGAPARTTLQNKGYKPIVENINLIEGAPIGETKGIHHNGWATTIDYWKNNRETLLRMASVKWRIMRFINDHPTRALKIQIPFLNNISGHKLTIEEGRVVYESLDPFFTFESQWGWFFDEKNRFNEDFPIRAAINSFESDNVISKGSVKPDQVSIAREVYSTMLDYKDKAEREFLKAESEIRLAEIQGKDVSKARELLEKARRFYRIYDYLDAYRFAVASKKWGSYVATTGATFK